MDRPQPAAPPAGLHMRHPSTHEDFVACVALQEDTWGAAFSERVPAAILKVSQRLGGITAGAFDAQDRLLGFVFGMTGVENGRLVHWSDMLAVRPELRDHGIGRRLKEFQRDTLLERGVGLVYWTFDPLAGRWRATTRAAFTWALEHGYHVAGFYRDAPAGRGYYVLARQR